MMKTLLRRRGKKPTYVERLTDGKKLTLVVSLSLLLSLSQSAIVPQQAVAERSVRLAPFEYRQANPYCHQLDYTGPSEQPTSIKMICFQESVIVTILPWRMNVGADVYGIKILDATLYGGALGVTFSIVDGSQTWTCRLERIIQGVVAQSATQTVDGGCVPTVVPDEMPPGTIHAELVSKV